jgi:tRNA dimethylallyltransferase
MLDEGWVAEVEALLSQGANPEWPGFASLGYREVVAHLDGRLALGELREAIVRKTRQYAKRQVTWFRHMAGAIPVDPAKAPHSLGVSFKI